MQYFGYAYFIGKVKCDEIVQIDYNSKQSIGDFVNFILKSQAIKDYEHFRKGVMEIQAMMEVTTNA